MRVQEQVVRTTVSAQLQAALDMRAGGTYLLQRSAASKVSPHHLYVLPHVGGAACFASFKNCADNVRTALLERVFYHQTRPGVFEAPVIPTAEQIGDCVGAFQRALRYRVNRLTPVPLLEYPSRTYRGRKLALYQGAAEKVATRGPLKSDSYLSTFLKHEKLLVGTKRVVPRVIQPRRPEYNVAVGRYLHQLEHFLYRDIDSVFGRPTVMKGYNAYEQGAHFSREWARYKCPRALGLDASRFDQHVSVPVLRWEHSVYDLYYRCPELRALLKWQLHNRGFVRTADATFQYAVHGGRCSGDMNTAMGNCLVMCALVYGLMAECGLVRASSTRVSLFNNGDDCVLIGERGDVELLEARVVAFFARAGFVMKVEPIVSVLEKVSFCQTSPVYDGRDWRMVRDPRASLSKDATLLGRAFAEQPRLSAQLYAIGQCGLALTGGLPLLQQYYTTVQGPNGPSRGVDERLYSSGFFQLARGLAPRARDITAEARVSFALAFDIPPDLQRALEEELRGIQLQPGPVQDQAVPHILL